MDFISLFSGAGGLDIGLEQAGWVCRYASDLDQAAVATLNANQQKQQCMKTNHPLLSSAFIEQSDVRKTSGAEILSKAGLRRGDAGLLAGGPPCQSWSSAGHQQGFKDPRGRLFSDFIRLADEMDVRWLLFENVRGLLTARGPDGTPGSALHLIRADLLSAGFQTAVGLLNAADFGVPQRRVRLFVIGYRVGDLPPFPTPTHAKLAHTENPKMKNWRSLGECLEKISPLRPEELIFPKGKMASDLVGILPGHGVKSPGKKETTRPGGHWGYKQGAFVADPSLPARTVTAGGQQDWVQDSEYGVRRLCPRECAAIQTFPPSWVFAGNQAAQYRLIGNAVPPQLAAVVGQVLHRHVSQSENAKRSKHLELLPLSSHLEAAIKYTAKEEMRNGMSRKFAPQKRISKVLSVAKF